MYKNIYENILDTNGLKDKDGRFIEDYIIPVNPDKPESMQFASEAKLLEFFGVENEENNYTPKGRTLRLHSSALLAFLFFHNLQGQKVKIPGLCQFGELTISKVHFEQSNIVFNTPSQIDVALLCKDKNNNSIIIYLESKFTENLKGIRSSKLSEQYRDKLIEIFGDKIVNKFGKGELAIDSSWLKECYSDGESLRYGEGLKQMIAHTLGVSNGPTNNNKLSAEIKKRNCTIVLGEIVYEFPPEVDSKGYLCAYSKAYNWLIKQFKRTITKDSWGNQIILLSKLVTYQELLSKNPSLPIDGKIKTFYRL